MFRYSYSTNEDLGCVASNTVASGYGVTWDTVKTLKSQISRIFCYAPRAQKVIDVTRN